MVPFMDYSFMNGMNGMNGSFSLRRKKDNASRK
jgi:hypothetical protein